MKQFDANLMYPRAQIALVIQRIYEKGMTTTSGGNISILDKNGDMWVTPSAVDKGKLTEKDIVCVKKNGSIIGKHKPSSEFPFHKAIYDVRTDVKAIIHAHSPALVSFSIVREIPNTAISPHTKLVCGSIGYATYGLPGSDDLGTKVAKAFESDENMAIIMENHGTVVGGTNLLDACSRFETLEFCARTLIHAKVIGEPIYLNEKQIESFEKQIPVYASHPSRISLSSEEKTIRNEICSIVHRACDHELMMGTSGTVSVRSKNNDFMITPAYIAGWNIRPDDVVQIKDGKAETGKIPDNYMFLHQKIYEQNPHVNSIIFAQAPNLMAFGITKEKFNVRTIPESYFTLLDIPDLPFGSQFFDNHSIPEQLGKSVRAVLVANDGLWVTGDKLLETFDRLEVAEFSAKSLVMAKSLGKMIPIDQAQIEALRDKYVN